MSDVEEQARRLDLLIDRLLRGQPSSDAGLDEPALAATARLLHEALPRLHPRFGFEDALAERLGSRSASTPPIPFPGAAAAGAGEATRRAWRRHRRGLVAGGAIASGVSIAIPLAGAALVRWRRHRSSGSHGGLV